MHTWCAHPSRGQAPTQGVFLCSSPLTQDFSLNLESLTQLDWLASGSQRPPYLCLLSAGVGWGDVLPCLPLYVGSGDLTSCLHSHYRLSHVASPTCKSFSVFPLAGYMCAIRVNVLREMVTFCTPNMSLAPCRNEHIANSFQDGWTESRRQSKHSYKESPFGPKAPNNTGSQWKGQEVSPGESKGAELDAATFQLISFSRIPQSRLCTTMVGILNVPQMLFGLEHGAVEKW